MFMLNWLKKALKDPIGLQGYTNPSDVHCFELKVHDT